MIREAKRSDAKAIAGIINHYVRESTCTFHTEPLTIENRREWLKARSPSHPVLVLELEGEVVGFGGMGPFKPRQAYAQTVESMVYLKPSLQGRGFGGELMREVITRARAAGHHAIIASICAEQAPSIRLHEKLGFQKVAHFRQVGKKFGRWLDVVSYELLLENES